MSRALSNPEPITFEQPSFPGWHDPGADRRLVWQRIISRVRLIWWQRQLLVRVAAAGLVIATATAFLIPPSYQSEVQLMPPDSGSDNLLTLLSGFGGGNSGSGLSGGGALGGLASDLLGMKSTGALFIGVLQSRTVQDHVIDRFNLKRIYHTSLEVKAEKKLSDNTEVSEDRKSGIITIDVTDHNAKRAAQIAGGYIDELNDLMATLNTSSAHRERVFLADRLQNISKEMEAAEQDFSQFSSRNTAIDVTAQARATLESSAMLQGQLIAAQSELQGLRQIYTENNVRVRSTEAQVLSLKQQLQKLAGAAQPPAVDGAADPPGELTATNSGGGTDGPYPSARELPVLGVGYADRLRRVKVDEAVFETLTKEYELAKVQEAKEIPTVKVLDPPNVPERKSFPPRLVIMVFGTIFAGILGAVWIVGTASWREVDPSDPRRIFAAEVFNKLEARYPWMSSNGRSVDHSGNGNSSGSDTARRSAQ